MVPLVEKTYTIGLDVHTLATAAVVYHHLYDGHGSTRALLRAADSTIVQKYAYDAYGNLQQLTGYMAAVDQALTSLLYSGEQTDKTGWQYLRARYYDPASGRFNRLDPFAGGLEDPQSLHKYLYTHGDPINGVDPSGEFLALLLTIAKQFSLQAAKIGGIIGATYGGIRGAIDAATGDDGSFEDILYGGFVGAVSGGIFGAALGGFGPALAAANLLVQASIFGGSLTASTYFNYQAISESFGNGNNAQGLARTAFAVVDTLLAGAGLYYAQGARADGSGRLAGRIMDPIARWFGAFALRGIGVKVKVNAAFVEYAGGPKANGAYFAAEKTIYLREEATWTEFMHEAFHAIHNRIVGNAYRNLPRAEKEQFVFDHLRRWFWNFMSSDEQRSATNYVNRVGGSAD